jgi:hypothetical protein
LRWCGERLTAASESLIASQISVSRQCDDLSLRAVANVKDKADRRN